MILRCYWFAVISVTVVVPRYVGAVVCYGCTLLAGWTTHVTLLLLPAFTVGFIYVYACVVIWFLTLVDCSTLPRLICSDLVDPITGYCSHFIYTFVGYWLITHLPGLTVRL